MSFSLMDAAQWLGGLLLLVVLAELLCRYWFRHIVRPTMYVPGQRWLLSVHEGFRPYLPQKAVCVINSEGERGYEPPQGPGVHRVLIYGASNAECRLLDQDRSLGGALERELNQPAARQALGAEKVHVGVVAQSGFDAAAVHTVMRHTLPHYRGLDTICILCGLSDAMRWLEAEAPSGRIPRPIKLDDMLVAHPEMRFPLRQPALLKAAQRLWQTKIRPDVVQENVGRYAIKERKARSEVKDFVHVDADPSAVVESFRRNMREAVELARKHARHVVIIRQYWLDKDEFPPEEDALLWGGRFGSPRGAGPARFVHHTQLLALFRLIDSTAEEVARETGAPSVNFFGYPEQKFGVYYDDFHYTHEGAEQAATVVARRLIETWPGGRA